MALTYVNKLRPLGFSAGQTVFEEVSNADFGSPAAPAAGMQFRFEWLVFGQGALHPAFGGRATETLGAPKILL